jgi:hypothetical protein
LLVWKIPAWRMTPCCDNEFTEAELPQNIDDTKEYIDEAFPIAMHAMREGIHFTLGSSPRSLAFNRDIFHNIPLIADWRAVTQRREYLTNENLIQENQKQCCCNYVSQQQILKKKWDPCKLGKQTIGPYQILQTHVNGTLTVELRPGVSERINIRRFIPYREPTVTYSHVPLETKPNDSELHNYKYAK